MIARVRTRVIVVTIMLFCCAIISITIFYFILFVDDLHSTADHLKHKPLIIIPFAELRHNNTVHSARKPNAYVSALNDKIGHKLKSLEHFFKQLKQLHNQLGLEFVESIRDQLRVTDEWRDSTSNASVWKVAHTWLTNRQIVAESAPQLSAVIRAMRATPIVFADVAKKGTQLKLLADLDGGQQVLLKPMRYSRPHIIDGIVSGADRHNGEIVAFVMSLVLNTRYAPIVGSRRVHVRREIRRVASPALLATFVDRNHSANCFYGHCYYCVPSEAVCPDENGTLEMAVILLLPKRYQLERLRHPWQRTYKTGVRAVWESDPNYCDLVMKRLALRPRILDLIDVSIFDYLIQNADRHHYEVFKNVANSAVLLIDNGKSFGNPFHDEITILAPLYQCCFVRNTTYQRLLLLSSTNVSQVMKDLLSTDPLSPLVTDDHLLSLDRRVKTIVALIHVCFDSKSKQNVLK